MNVLMLSPAFPNEMGFFTRGLARVGARVYGLGDQPASALPPMVRGVLHGYLRVRSLGDRQAVIDEVRAFDRKIGIDRIACLWEPTMMLAAELRQALDLPGMGPEQTRLFRDKEAMKQRLDEAGIRTPRHARARGAAEVRQAAERIGFPLVVKPIAGAGSMDTYQVADGTELEETLRRTAHVPEVSVEEFIDGEEHTFDTICAGGRVLFHSVAWYRPRVLVARSLEWLSPQTVTLRHPDQPRLAAGIEMGRRVLEALGFEDGFSHMEWFLTESGEAVFGEIGARSPGAHSVDLMNYACDFDAFEGWAEATVHGRLSQPIERRFNSAIIFKRARGQGRIERIEGLERLVARYRAHVVCVDLRPVGAPRRNWKQTLLSDGFVICRHESLDFLTEMADRFGTDLQLFAS